MLMKNDRILIIGTGNILLGDEGFGVHAVRYLEEHYSWPENVRLLDGGTMGLMLMSELMECELAIILDIAEGGSEPGTFYRIAGEELARNSSIKQSMHHTGIADVLISCKLAGYCPKTVIFAMEPFNYQNLSAELTDAAREKLPVFCERVIEQAVKMGIEPLRKIYTH